MALNIESKVKLNNGVEMPLFGLGMYLAKTGAAAVAAEQALRRGYIHLDSAVAYRNEWDCGEAIRKSGVERSKIFVTTKYDMAGGSEDTIKKVENSLAVMNIGPIDQYLLHAPSRKAFECYDVLLEYQAKGLIKTVGVSNFDVDDLEAIKQSGRPLPQVNQILFNPWYPNTPIVKWCKENGVHVVGYSPLARDPQKLKHPLAMEVASKYKKTPAQVLIRWSLQHGFTTIPKTVNPQRINENADVFDFELSKADMDKLSSLRSM